MEEISLLAPSERHNFRDSLIPFITTSLVLLAVGSVYISQLVFQEIALSFDVDALDARYAFSIATIVYAFSFFLFGPYPLIKHQLEYQTEATAPVLGS